MADSVQLIEDAGGTAMQSDRFAATSRDTVAGSLRYRRRVWARVVLAALVGLPGLALAGEVAIVNARILAAPDAMPIERGTLLLRDGVIQALGATVEVPEGAERIDAQGATAVAGYWNSHVHFIAPPLSQAQQGNADALGRALTNQYLRWGFTTVFDIASMPGNAFALRARVASGEVNGPAILTVDEPFYPEGGTPIYVLEFPGMGEDARAGEVSTAAQAGQRARSQLAAGADGLKVFSGAIVGGETGVVPMPVEVVRAVSAPARAAG